MSPDTIEVLKTAGPYVLAAYGTIVLVKERLSRVEKEDEGIKGDVKVMALAVERQTIMHKLTADTLDSLVKKFESLEQRVNTNTTQIAILQSKGK